MHDLLLPCIFEGFELPLTEMMFVQKLFKQGIHDLKSQQYQLLYVDDGVLHGPELEDWKVLKATETY